MKIVGKLPKLSFKGSDVTVVRAQCSSAEPMDKVNVPIAENTEEAKENEILYLPVTQQNFNAILSGKKIVEHREIKESTAGKYLASTPSGNPLLNPDNTLQGELYYLNDYNNGNFPFIPLRYKQLRLVVGYAKNRDELLVNVKDIVVRAENIRDGFADWVIEYHLGDIVKIKNR
jgi:hypothetical protein